MIILKNTTEVLNSFYSSEAFAHFYNQPYTKQSLSKYFLCMWNKFVCRCERSGGVFELVMCLRLRLYGAVTKLCAIIRSIFAVFAARDGD